MCDALNKMVYYMKYKYIYIYVYNFKTHSLEDSKENTRKLTILLLSPHTSLILENTIPKIIKKNGNIRTSLKMYRKT